MRRRLYRCLTIFMADGDVPRKKPGRFSYLDEPFGMYSEISIVHVFGILSGDWQELDIV